MPRPNMNPEEAPKGGTPFGVQAGRYVVVASEFAIKVGDQTPNNQNPTPKCGHNLTLAHIDAEGNQIDDAATEELFLPAAGDKQGVSNFQPGDAEEDPGEDDYPSAGEEVGTVGNILWSKSGEAPNRNTALTIFNMSAVKKGANKSDVARGWAPDWVGLKFELAITPANKLEKYGSENSDLTVSQGKRKGEPVTYRVIENIIELPEGLGGAKAKAKAKPAAKAATKPNGKVKEEEADTDTDGAEVPGEMIDHLMTVAGKFPGKSIKAATLVGYFTSAAMQALGTAKAKPVVDAGRKFLATEAGLRAAAEIAGGELNGEMIKFA